MTADLTPGHGARKTLEPVVVEVIEGPGKGPRATLAGGTLLVGSDPACGLHLEDPTVSRRHVMLELLPEAVQVLDLGSRNGTRYLGARIREARVPIGGSVTVGKTTLRIRPVTVQPRAISDREELHGLVGKSVAMRQLFADLERLGPQRPGAHSRGDGLGQGAGGAGAARPVRGRGAAGPLRRLRLFVREPPAHGERAVRPREGSLRRGGGGSRGRVGGGQRRDALPG